MTPMTACGSSCHSLLPRQTSKSAVAASSMVFRCGDVANGIARVRLKPTLPTNERDSYMCVHVSREKRCLYNKLPLLQRPPSSSLSYPGAGGNDDARSPGSGGTPGPLSQQAPTSLDSSDPGNENRSVSRRRGAPMVSAVGFSQSPEGTQVHDTIP
ncbi:Homeobox protein homothorax, partial [Anthophora quadrimaculata]